MSILGSVVQTTVLGGLSWMGFLGGFSSPGAPRAAFEVSSGNPAAGAAVRFQDLSSGSPTGWVWDFGDGTGSTERNPRHVYGASGTYPVSLRVSNGNGSTVSAFSVSVTEAATLRLLAGHPFDVTLMARDPRSGNTGVGEAIPQNDVFGYFTVPALVPTSGVVVPEVFVKMLDATPIGQNYWVFYGGLTDLEYTLTFREVATGREKVFHNPVTDSRVCLGADTSGFFDAASPTATPPGSSPTPTPTPTPPAGATVVNLTARQFQWNFTGGGATGGSSFTARVGQTYEFRIASADVTHGFGGIPSLGLSAGVLNPGSTVIRTFTAAEAHVGPRPFACNQESCGEGHTDMVAVITVEP